MSVHIKAQFLRAEIDRIVAAYPELMEDQELLADTLEGETELNALVATLLDMADEAATMADAVSMRVDTMSERRARLKRKNEAARSIIKSLMEHAGLEKITLPEATISISKPRQTVEVVNVDDLPQGFFRIERQADKKAIQSALEAGETVPGAVMADGKTSLMIRTK